MNKAADLYYLFLADVGDTEKAKKCVLTFVEEMEKLGGGELTKHSPCWWAYTLQRIREDLEQLIYRTDDKRNSREVP